jgi:hypothetical protein
MTLTRSRSVSRLLAAIARAVGSTLLSVALRLAPLIAVDGLATDTSDACTHRLSSVVESGPLVAAAAHTAPGARLTPTSAARPR